MTPWSPEITPLTLTSPPCSLRQPTDRVIRNVLYGATLLHQPRLPAHGVQRGESAPPPGHHRGMGLW